MPRERRSASSLPGNTQLRNRARDALNDIDAGWMYTSAEMAIWRAWYETALLNGLLWFAVTAPGAGGWAQRVVKFRTKTLKAEYLGNGVFRVGAQLQHRGISAVPAVSAGILLAENATGWEYQSIAHHANPGTTNLTQPGSGWSTDQAPFGGGEAGVLPEFIDPNTDWPIKTILWARRDVPVPAGVTQVVLRYWADNGCIAFIDGVPFSSLNLANVQDANLPVAYRQVLLTLSSAFELSFKCFDETTPAGGTTLLICAAEDADGTTIETDPPAGFGFASAFAVSSPATDAQGIATDGTNLWYSNSSELRKYTKAGTLVASRNVMGDNPTDKQQVNGLFIKAGVLYVSAAKYVAGVGTSWIAEYDPDTLTYITHHTLSIDAFAEGCSFHSGHWWVIFHATQVVAQYDTNWTFVASYALSYSITGASGGYGSGHGYDGIAWLSDDYLLVNIHEIYNEAYCDVYQWTGSSFAEVVRLAQPSSKATQGLAADPVDTGVMWFAERNYSGADGVAKTAIVR